MTVIVHDYAQAVDLPGRRNNGRRRVCRYARASEGMFCASCPDVDELPCVQQGVCRDCTDCTETDCPCMRSANRKRRQAYQEWRKKHDRNNGMIYARHMRYTRKRRQIESAGHLWREKDGKANEEAKRLLGMGH